MNLIRQQAKHLLSRIKVNIDQIGKPPIINDRNKFQWKIMEVEQDLRQLYELSKNKDSELDTFIIAMEQTAYFNTIGEYFGGPIIKEIELEGAYHVLKGNLTNILKWA